MLDLLFKARAQGKDLRLALSDEDRILIVSGQGMICCNNGPVIVHQITSGVPALIIGSMARVIPAVKGFPFSLSQSSGLPDLHEGGYQFHVQPARGQRHSRIFRRMPDCRGDIIQMIACFREFNTFVKALFCDIHQFLCFRETFPTAQVRAASEWYPYRSSPHQG